MHARGPSQAGLDGDLRRGQGEVTAASGAFRREPGTSPEQLIAVGHAGCFTVALAGVLAKEGRLPPGPRD